MKILIINCGLLRSFRDVFDNQYKNLYLANKNHFIRTVLVTEPLPLKREQYTSTQINEIYSKIDNFTSIIIPAKPFIKRGYPSFREQFFKMDLGLSSVKDFTTYDQIIRIRPDLIIEQPIQIEYFDGLQGIVGWDSSYSYQLMHDVIFCGTPNYIKTLTEFKKGWLYKLRTKEDHFYFSKNKGKEAEVQILLHAGYQNIDVRSLNTGVCVVQNSKEIDDLNSNNKEYYKLRSDSPIIHKRDVIIKI